MPERGWGRRSGKGEVEKSILAGSHPPGPVRGAMPRVSENAAPQGLLGKSQ